MASFSLQTPEEFVGFGFQVPGVDLLAILNEQESANMMETTIGESLVTTTPQPVAMNRGLQHEYACASFLSPILSILFCLGCLGSVLGCFYAGFCSTKARQNVNFVHLFLANVGSILFIPFTVSARSAGYWFLPHEVFVALSFITSLSQVVTAFQLTLLAALRCKQCLSNEEFVATNCTKVVSFFIWIIALPVAALSIFDAEILAGTIKSERFLQTSQTEVLYIITFVFGTLIPVATMLICVVYSYRQRTAHGENGKTSSKLQRDIREVTLLLLLYIVCCVPIQILRLSPKALVDGCGTALNILICAAALFSVLSPILHIAYVASSGQKGDDSSSISKDSELSLNAVNELGEQNAEKGGEKAV